MGKNFWEIKPEILKNLNFPEKNLVHGKFQFLENRKLDGSCQVFGLRASCESKVFRFLTGFHWIDVERVKKLKRACYELVKLQKWSHFLPGMRQASSISMCTKDFQAHLNF